MISLTSKRWFLKLINFPVVLWASDLVGVDIDNDGFDLTLKLKSQR